MSENKRVEIDVTQDQSDAWAKEFEVLGAAAVDRHTHNGDYPQGSPRRRVALQWLQGQHDSPLGGTE